MFTQRAIIIKMKTLDFKEIDREVKETKRKLKINKELTKREKKLKEIWKL